MAIYNYKCSECGYNQDVIVNNDNLRICPSCGKASFKYNFEPSVNIGMKINTESIKSTSSDSKVWDRLIGESAEKGRDIVKEQLKEKEEILKRGHYPMHNPVSGFHPALYEDVPQVLLNRKALSPKNKKFRDQIKNIKADMSLNKD